MIAGIRILRLLMLIPVSGALLIGQHGFGGGPHSAGTGHSSAGIGRSPIAPFHMPPTIGIGRSSIAGTGPVYGNHFVGRYPGVSQGYGRYNRYPYGPWRRNSRYGRFTYALPYAYFGAPYYPLFFDSPYADDSDYYNAPAYPSDPEGGAPPDDSGLGAQVQQLSAQISGLQDQLARGAQPALPSSDSTPAAPPSPPITVVLNTGQTLQVHDYAVMGDTFWDFSAQPARKIPLSKIDISASARASEANGAEFPQVGSPRSSEAR